MSASEMAVCKAPIEIERFLYDSRKKGTRVRNISTKWYRMKLNTIVAGAEIMQGGNYSHKCEYARSSAMVLGLRPIGMRISRLNGQRKEWRVNDGKDPVHRRGHVQVEEALQQRLCWQLRCRLASSHR